MFSKYASPVRILVRAFNSTYKYSEKDIPEIDLLFITHDHWDHLDYNTFMQLKNRVKHIVTGLGVGAHLEKWGYPANQITELYWWESVTIDNFQITATPSRHFSGRTFKRNTTLWSSFVLKGSKQIFLGGDSGYGTHFQKIGEEFGPFDFAILENGQYDALWNTVHMFPEEAVQAAKDLQAKHAIPVHSGKFALAKHPWYEPLARFSKEAKTQALKSLTPSVGQLLDLDNPAPPASWWEKIN